MIDDVPSLDPLPPEELEDGMYLLDHVISPVIHSMRDDNDDFEEAMDHAMAHLVLADEEDEEAAIEHGLRLQRMLIEMTTTLMVMLSLVTEEEKPCGYMHKARDNYAEELARYN